MVVGALAMAAGAQEADAPKPAPAGGDTAVLLEKAIYTEEIVGDLDAAIGMYRQIVERAKEDQRRAAHAQYRLAMCHLKKKDQPRAVAALEELLATFPTQPAAAKARKELAKLRAHTAAAAPRPPVWGPDREAILAAVSELE